MTEERLNEIRAMVNTGFIPAPGNATVAQLLEYSDSLEEQNKRLQNANQSLRRTLTREALKDANYNVEIVRLRKELEEKEREAQQWRSKYDSKHELLVMTDTSRNEKDRMYREALEAANRYQQELEEARKIRFPRQPGGKYGWELDFDYLKNIQLKMQRETEHSINLEEIEAVLLTLERVSQEGEGNQCK
jgi:hypothetical protein